MVHVKHAPGSGGRLSALAVLLVAVMVAALFVAIGSITGLLDFGSKTIDRSQPPLLIQLSDLAEYRAASANFEVIVDLEKDTKYLPDFLSGQRAVMVAAGDVDAKVDFGALTSDKIVVSEDRRSVTVTLPAPVLTEVRIDNSRTYVASRNRGLFDRVAGAFSGNPVDDQKLYAAAENKLREAAAQTALIDKAQTNTRAMLESLLHSLGFTNVTVVFEAPPAG
jgi:hypothetical protein